MKYIKAPFNGKQKLFSSASLRLAKISLAGNCCEALILVDGLSPSHAQARRLMYSIVYNSSGGISIS